MKRITLIVLGLSVFIGNPANAARGDCITYGIIEWIRVGQTENKNFNNNRSTVVVKTDKSNSELLLNISMNLDDHQGGPILALLNSAMTTKTKVTLRGDSPSCTVFDEVVVHASWFGGDL
ncbi:hypothetical protein [Photobacterium leiognathi]|uniref:hypothetical protein n=1 Tax=Photobacterium leiognathi TaxID=553611 RepID=UPI00298147DA|nr:hypothetical protein [Photobacterium leiognathi]